MFLLLCSTVRPLMAGSMSSEEALCLTPSWTVGSVYLVEQGWHTDPFISRDNHSSCLPLMLAYPRRLRYQTKEYEWRACVSNTIKHPLTLQTYRL